MAVPGRQVVLGVGVGVVSVAMVAGSYLLGRHSSDRAAVVGPTRAATKWTPGHAPWATRSPWATRPAPVPAPAPVPRPPKTKLRSAGETTLSATGAILQPPAIPNMVGGTRSMSCRRLAAAANPPVKLTLVRCGEATAVAPSGEPVTWLVNRVQISNALQVQLWAFGDGSWSQTLVGTESRPGVTWTDIDVRPARLTRGGATLVVEFRSQGTRRALSYDLVRVAGVAGAPDARVKVAAHRDGLAHGVVAVTPTPTGEVIDEYSANLSDGAPECCPTTFDHVRIGFQRGSLRLLGADQVPTSRVPAPPG